MNTLGERMSAVRKSRGLSQEEVAQRAHVHQQAISRLECGDREHVRSDVLGRLAIALEVSADYLLGLETPVQAPPAAPATSHDSDSTGQRQSKRKAKPKA